MNFKRGLSQRIGPKSASGYGKEWGGISAGGGGGKSGVIPGLTVHASCPVLVYELWPR